MSSRRIPEADFVDELLKALALLSITAKQKQSGDIAVLKGITWAQVSCNDPPVLNLLSKGSYTALILPLYYPFVIFTCYFLTVSVHCPQQVSVSCKFPSG